MSAPELYADSGSWYEILLTMVELHLVNPNDAEFSSKYQPMLINNRSFWITTGLLGLTCVLFQLPTHAETPRQWTQFRPADASEPPQSNDGGSRGSSLYSPQQVPLTALTPAQGGVTVEEYPTFFVFVPQAEEATEPLSAEFVIIDDQDNIIYETTLKLSQKASLVRIDIPKTATPLELDKLYQWYFSVGSDLDMGNTVFSFIKRVKPSPMLLEAIQNTQPETLPEVYADSGIWYETLLAMIELRQANPNNAELREEWKKLLESVGLEKIANQSLFSVTPTSQNRPRIERPIPRSRRFEYKCSEAPEEQDPHAPKNTGHSHCNP